MKTIPRHLKAISLVLVSVLTAPFALAQPSENSSGAISVDRSVHYAQTDFNQVTLQQTPYNFTFHVRGGSATLKTNWGPKFYKAGSGGVVQSGTSSATNTGTLNFSNTPNNGSDFMFVHEFSDDAAMQAFYPIAPTGGGQYGVKFLGSAPPTPAEFTDGLVYAAGITYPTSFPQIVAPTNAQEIADANGATFSGGKLHIKSTGLTTLKLSPFTQYSSTTYGSLIAVGIYDAATGAVVDGPSATSYYLPVGDSSEDPGAIVQPAITEVTIDGSWLIAGRSYTLELVYAIIAGRPEEATLSGVEFQGVSSYRSVTTIGLTTGVAKADFDSDGNSDLVWQHPYYQIGAVWNMDGTTFKSSAVFEGLPAGRIAGSGDFNGDGKTDLVIQSLTTNNVEVAFMDGATVLSHVTVADNIPDWQIVGTGDFNHDGKTDLIWEHPAYSITAVWLMNGPYLMSSAVINDGGMVGWHVVGSGDFNGDGSSDLIWQHTTYGIIGVWLLDGTTLLSTAAVGTEANAKVVGSGDYNHDGQSDLILQNSAGDVTVWFMDGLNQTSSALMTSVPEWQIVNK